MKRSSPPRAIINKEQILPKQQRPKCRYCGEPLRPEITWNWTDRSSVPVARAFTGRYGDQGDGEFCNHRCGYNWGVAIAQSITNGERKLIPNSAAYQEMTKSQ
jgi:hypothetical protein